MRRSWLWKTVLVFSLYTTGMAAGFALARGSGGDGSSLAEQLKAKRLMAFGRFPLRQIGRALVAGDLPRTSILMTVVNLNGAVLHFLAGMLYLSPVLALIQGFMVGNLLALANSARTYLFSALVLPFEVGAFALSGALGMEMAGRRWGRMGPGRDAPLGRPGLIWGLPVVLLLQAAGGILEAAGALRLKLPGALSMEEIAGAVADAPSR